MRVAKLAESGGLARFAAVSGLAGCARTRTIRARGSGVAYGARTRNLWSHNRKVRTHEPVLGPAHADAKVGAYRLARASWSLSAASFWRLGRTWAYTPAVVEMCR